MKVTVDLPEDLLRTLEARAVREERTVSEVAAQLLRQELAKRYLPERRADLTLPRLPFDGPAPDDAN